MLIMEDDYHRRQFLNERPAAGVRHYEHRRDERLLRFEFQQLDAITPLSSLKAPELANSKKTSAKKPKKKKQQQRLRTVRFFSEVRVREYEVCLDATTDEDDINFPLTLGWGYNETQWGIDEHETIRRGTQKRRRRRQPVAEPRRAASKLSSRRLLSASLRLNSLERWKKLVRVTGMTPHEIATLEVQRIDGSALRSAARSGIISNDSSTGERCVGDDDFERRWRFNLKVRTIMTSWRDDDEDDSESSPDFVVEHESNVAAVDTISQSGAPSSTKQRPRRDIHHHYFM